MTSGSTPRDGTRAVTRRVAFSAASVPLARHQLETWIGAGGAPTGTVDDARLVVSELVANALRHASPRPDGMLVVALRLLGGSVEVSVGDGGGPSVPHTSASPPFATSGRGLRIVSAIVERWWVTEDSDGRTVHALIPPR